MPSVDVSHGERGSGFLHLGFRCRIVAELKMRKGFRARRPSIATGIAGGIRPIPNCAVR